MEGVDPNIVAFADAARRFCTLVEGASFEEPFNLDAIRKRLADLHARVLELPALGCGDVDAPDIPPEMWQRVYGRALTLPVNTYWDVFDPVNVKNHEVVWSELADDLADIWEDLRRGLSLFEQDHVVEAVWEWKNSFDTHWGQHLLSAQRAIHSRLTAH